MNKFLNVLSILLLLLILSCSKSDEEYLKDFNNYEVVLSNNDYDINLSNGAIESDYFDIKGSLSLSKNEQLVLARLFFDNKINKPNDDVLVFNNDGMVIHPDITSSIIIKYFGKDKSTITISGFADSTKVRKENIRYLRFKSKVYKVLNQNEKFKKIKKSIDSKEDDRVYL
ncbi:hypothetical protein [Epilithonimonas arachidiradicis]|uniref:Uncharacterized protein n=1 Tax=Epilithonimonas arachidiradicis TaxID=1617282 RepID=A0A420DCL1_9FLAO|nr:hypothetical protein [Epilithonimonas arachidiradicis]RKE89543.1 hypothetical protein BXY58_0107 [Epilithonimonas arachidiradicis]GGG43305.1 hypothetical protein GCM10007332_01000 [Epilithonimonas arachidiradicis]